MKEKDKLTEQTIKMLKRDGGAKISEIAEELSIDRSEARQIVNQINEQYEIGSSADFRYRILKKLDENWESKL